MNGTTREFHTNDEAQMNWNPNATCTTWEQTKEPKIYRNAQ